MSINDDYTTGNILDYLYDQKYFKLITIDLSRKKMPIFLKKTILEEN